VRPKALRPKSLNESRMKMFFTARRLRHLFASQKSGANALRWPFKQFPTQEVAEAGNPGLGAGNRFAVVQGSSVDQARNLTHRHQVLSPKYN